MHPHWDFYGGVFGDFLADGKALGQIVDQHAVAAVALDNVNVAEQWLESADKEARIVEEFEDVLIGLEKKELKDLLKMARYSHEMRQSIDHLRYDLSEAKKKVA